jgi:ribosomal protein S21
LHYEPIRERKRRKKIKGIKRQFKKCQKGKRRKV